MQLKFKRYNGSKGMLSSKTTYCVEAMLVAARDEEILLDTYQRWDTRLADYGDFGFESDEEELRKQFSNLTVRQLTQGAKFEYTNMNHVLRTENQIVETVQQVLRTVRYLATFDGTERIVDVDKDSAAVVASG